MPGTEQFAMETVAAILLQQSDSDSHTTNDVVRLIGFMVGAREPAKTSAEFEVIMELIAETILVQHPGLGDLDPVHGDYTLDCWLDDAEAIFGEKLRLSPIPQRLLTQDEIAKRTSSIQARQRA